jgi:hypothetical protein
MQKDKEESKEASVDGFGFKPDPNNKEKNIAV